MSVWTCLEVDEHGRGLWQFGQVKTTDPVIGAVQPGYGFLLHNVHSIKECEHRHCVIHNPSEHHMREWPLLYRADRNIFERTCPHGVGHPDPDQYEYWKETNQEFQASHGCDGCCVPPEGT